MHLPFRAGEEEGQLGAGTYCGRARNDARGVLHGTAEEVLGEEQNNVVQHDCHNDFMRPRKSLQRPGDSSNKHAAGQARAESHDQEHREGQTLKGDADKGGSYRAHCQLTLCTNIEIRT